MRSKAKKALAEARGMETIIYEQPGEIGEITAKRMMDIILAYDQMHPEVYEECRKAQVQTESAGECHA